MINVNPASDSPGSSRKSVVAQIPTNGQCTVADAILQTDRTSGARRNRMSWLARHLSSIRCRFWIFRRFHRRNLSSSPSSIWRRTALRESFVALFPDLYFSSGQVEGSKQHSRHCFQQYRTIPVSVGQRAEYGNPPAKAREAYAFHKRSFSTYQVGRRVVGRTVRRSYSHRPCASIPRGV